MFNQEDGQHRSYVIQGSVYHVEVFSWKTTSHKDHLEVCLPTSRLLFGLYGMWSSMIITLVVYHWNIPIKSKICRSINWSRQPLHSKVFGNPMTISGNKINTSILLVDLICLHPSYKLYWQTIEYLVHWYHCLFGLFNHLSWV